jgi:hypothetical protein
MITIDPWERAADCDRLMNAAADPSRKAIFAKLRELWITLGNEKAMMTEGELAAEIEAIGRLHADLTASREHLVH